MLAAEDRRAPTPRDLAVVRSGLRSGDPQTARIAVRALGRLERPPLIVEIIPMLRHPLPEIRAQAADAVAQAAQGFKKATGPGRVSAVRRTGGPRTAAADPLDAAAGALAARLKVETDGSVRAALCESLGRLPFTTAGEIADAEDDLLESLTRDSSIDGRLGVAKGLFHLAGVARKVAPLSDASVAALRELVAPNAGEAATAARIRRLAIDSLTIAGQLDSDVIRTASADPDPQVRRLAAKAAGTRELDAMTRSALVVALSDGSPMVRYEALRVVGAAPADGGCAAAIRAAADRDAHVALLALDILGSCEWSTAAVDLLDRAVREVPTTAASRDWHRAAHALVAVSKAAPARGTAALGQFSSSRNHWLRLYAAQAAAILKDRAALQRLAADDDDNVREAAIAGLSKDFGHEADAVYVSELDRNDHQLIRTAALALKGTPTPDIALPALQAALQRLKAEGHDNSHDARAALAETLGDLGIVADPARVPDPSHLATEITPVDLQRLQGARARIMMRNLGTFDLALITMEAPTSVIRFARLAASGYYNGLTFHRVVPNFVIQGGSPGANEYAGDAMFMRDELGLWPHVRGAVGVSTRGHDTGDAQIFIDTVDNPRLDHEYTVFAQVLNGINIVDEILEGDVIERIDIVPGS